MELKFTVTPKQLKEKLMRLVEMEEPPAVFLWGRPGIGKTQVVYQVGEETGRHVEVLILSLMDPTELKGFVFPNREAKRAEILPLSFPDEPFILFFDEFNTAPVSVQNAAMRIVLEKKIGNYHLPKGTLVVCAGNRLKDKAAVNKISSAMVNRALHYVVVPSFEDFKEYWFAKRLPAEVVAYLEMDTQFFSTEPQIDKPFPSPRSWEMVGRILEHKLANLEDIAGLVGEEAAVRFDTFMRRCAGITTMIEQILNGEKVYPSPEEVEKGLMIATILINRTTEDNIKVLLEYALNAPKYMSPHIILWMKSIIKMKVITLSTLFSKDMAPLTKKFAEVYKYIIEEAK
ncbi:ATP-binding protein [Candidatus Caldatribacterium sp.]|uniref:ATP-binding protein n=1 Tax=Candidatus Caldatribacterium sp. TaxID=2282143 RepID=UPI0038488A87|nr:AAA family ATPase [Candidatus Caldatribacterium sp.]